VAGGGIAGPRTRFTGLADTAAIVAFGGAQWASAAASLRTAECPLKAAGPAAAAVGTETGAGG
tara:strand:- start:440 stop:628 length:189 start_codon:yes stop_codon:yes gene_type:complete